MSRKIVGIFLISLLNPELSFSNKLIDAFDALQRYDLYQAKNLFNKCLKKDSAAAAFGLSKLYFLNSQPYYSLDSAFKYVLISEKTLPNINPKKEQLYGVLGVQYLSILELRSEISTAFFEKVELNPSVDAYNHFIESHPWANELNVGIFRRDSLVFETVNSNNTSIEYANFMKLYPQSAFFKSAEDGFYLSQYKEYTKTNTVGSFLNFINSCPKNPYIGDAEDRVYEISTDDNTLLGIKLFIQSYPNNRNIGEAWKRLYQVYMFDYADNRLDQFILEFPEYPYKDELLSDLEVFKMNLLPFKHEQFFGYMDYDGNVIIPASYDQLGFFHEGLAFAAKDGKYGFINKKNELVVPFEFDAVGDFVNGRAIVEKNEFSGMIDRSGNIVFPIEFLDLDIANDDLIFALKDSLYGFYDWNYNLRIPEKYNEVFPFENDLAKVKIGFKEAFIDEYGTTAVPLGFDNISFFSDTLLVFEENQKFGLMNKNCQVVTNATYDQIGKLSDNRAVVIKGNFMGYIDATGKLIIPTNFEIYPNCIERAQFMSSYAVVKQKGKMGVIDISGKLVIPCNFINIGEIGAIMSFTKGNLWGFMDLKGKEVMTPVYDFAETFKQNMAIVEKNGLQGIVDISGKELLPISFESIERFTNNLILVGQDDKYGLYTQDLKLVVPLQYDQIRQLSENLILLVSKNEVHYLYLSDYSLIQPKFN